MTIETIDKKILNWNAADFNELVDSFTKEEIEEMTDYLEYMSNRYEDGFHYSFNSKYEYDNNGDIVYDYIRHNAFSSIRDDRWCVKPDWISVLLATE